VYGLANSGIGSIFLIFGVILLLIVYFAIIFWYITIPVIALIIVYKKRKSIWKPKDKTFLNDEVRENYKNGTMYDYDEETNSNQQYEGAWHERDEWTRQQNAEDERRTREFWEEFWEDYEPEEPNWQSISDETFEEEQEDFEDAWQQFKDQFEQEYEYEDYTEYYKTLGLTQGVTYEEVKRRFRELALKYHPDRYKGNKQTAAKKFKQIFEAYNKIKEKMEMEA
jgi:hypothetical protein